jgi:signal transduction histidine kinase
MLPAGDNQPGNTGHPTEMIACYDQHGQLITSSSSIGTPSRAFLDMSLVRQVLNTGAPESSDTVDVGSTTGRVYRVAVEVHNANGAGFQGVVVVGEGVEFQENVLSLLLGLLLTTGSIVLLGAGLGGLFLANRALEPAHLAWTNQQRFIADAAHELRTPLTLLRADAEVLLRGRSRLAEDDAELLEDIVAETSHMTILATNMLTMARLDAGALHQEHEVIDLAELASGMARRIQALAAQSNISVVLEHIDSPYIIGDRSLLEQATLVLLDNAIKYNRPNGCITVRILTQLDHAVLEVIDTGIGIANEHLPRLGQRFYRVDKARSRQAGGTGLGLSIARSIALRHGGQLTYDSVANKGTTATLSLPLARIPSGERL